MTEVWPFGFFLLAFVLAAFGVWKGYTLSRDIREYLRRREQGRPQRGRRRAAG